MVRELSRKLAVRLFSFDGLALPLVLLLTAAGPSAAGSLCGTVRDAASSAPIPNAGVFLRETGGAYTGLNGATSAAGSFCIHSVPPGTYDLEVLVDDYRVGYVRDVTVTGTVTDVPVELVGLGLSLRRPYPSPAESEVTFSWQMPAAARARLMVFDAQGRLVSVWASPSLSPGEKKVVWDLRDHRGVRVRAGVYYLRLEAGAERCVRRFVCLP